MIFDFMMTELWGTGKSYEAPQEISKSKSFGAKFAAVRALFNADTAIVQTSPTTFDIGIQSARFDETKSAIESVLQEYLDDISETQFQLHFYAKIFNPTIKQRKIRNEI